jgi:dTDP-4-dehydrorhamnose 3,5-epimerase
VKFRGTRISGAYVIELEPHVDDRGSFARAYCKREFDENGISFEIVQSNFAYTKDAGVIRGLHYQEPPMQERKLVRCISGAVLDVLVDMRPSSPSFRLTLETRLDARNRYALFIPAGVAHGYQTLDRNTEFFYMTDQFYAPGLEKGVRYSDPALSISWPLPPHGVTERDANWPLLS